MNPSGDWQVNLVSYINSYFKTAEFKADDSTGDYGAVSTYYHSNDAIFILGKFKSGLNTYLSLSRFKFQ